jgi:hypothetical protein
MLLSVAGVGPLTAAASLAAFKHVPFEHKDAFVAYIGNDLVVEESGQSRGRRHVSSCGDRTLRSLFVVAGARPHVDGSGANTMKSRSLKGCRPPPPDAHWQENFKELFLAYFKAKDHSHPIPRLTRNYRIFQVAQSIDLVSPSALLRGGHRGLGRGLLESTAAGASKGCLCLRKFSGTHCITDAFPPTSLRRDSALRF